MRKKGELFKSSAGIPARVIRQQKNEGRVREELNHVWLNHGAFPDERSEMRLREML
jgi:hypothetical protein